MAREILVADPNKAAHKAFEEIFKETGYHLIFSENGEDALLKMKLFKPALVIADVTMPDKNGKELCQMLKGDPDLNKVPFVLLGGPFDEDIEEEKNQVRADGAITKPLKREPILSLVDGLLTAGAVEGPKEAEEEILELQPIEEGTEARSSAEEEEVIDLLDIIEEPTARPEEVAFEAPVEPVKSEETKEPTAEGILGEEALAALAFLEDSGVTKGEETIQTQEMEVVDQEPEVSAKVDVDEEPAMMEAMLSAEEAVAEFGGVGETAAPEREELGAQEVTGGVPAEETGEVPQDVLKEKGLEDALAEEIGQLSLEETPEPERVELGAEEIMEELPTEGIGEVPPDILKKDALAEEIEELPLEETPEPERGDLGAEEIMEELPTEGIGEVPQDVLKEKGLEEALAEEIEELPGDLLGEKDTPDEGKVEFEGLEELGGETEALRDEEEGLEEALRELSGEDSEEGELERLSGGEISTEEFEWQPSEASQEMDLEGLAQKVLEEKEDDVQAFDEGGLKEEGAEESHEEVFKEGELEKLAEEATREGEGEEIPEGALAEAIEKFTGETLREGEEIGVQSPGKGPVQKTISGAVKEMVEGMSAKILPELTEAIAVATAEKIEKTVQKLVPELAEKAIQKEIKRLENLKKGEDFDI
jgi:CheY-like chemotaxis protein